MTPKQSSWFKTDKDIKFENSFKFWFALNWQNWNIQLFLLTFPLLLLQLIFSYSVYLWWLDAWFDGIGTGLFVSAFWFVLPSIVTAIIYKGFYQHFNDLKNGTTR